MTDPTPDPLTAPAEPAVFDLAGPLPTGLTLLEASAGTGKTFAIAALVVRFIAAGTPIDRLLVVTFTRAATGELRERIRRRLIDAATALSTRPGAAVSGERASGEGASGEAVSEQTDAGAGDPVHRLLADGSAEEVERRRSRLAAALADFDRATIVTTHAFCDQVLRSLGTAGDVARDVTFLDDPRDLVEEAVDDFYLRKFARQPGTPEFSHDVAIRIAVAATANPGLDLEPRHAPEGSESLLRYRFASNVRAELERRKEEANTLGYDDILRSLADSLDRRGAHAALRLRQRFQVVLVDEFQDTDPTQSRILERAFVAEPPDPASDGRVSDGQVRAGQVTAGQVRDGQVRDRQVSASGASGGPPGGSSRAGPDGPIVETDDQARHGRTEGFVGSAIEPRPTRALVLVGDPKQAIYSFRGADVHTYLRAAAQARRLRLAVNWRSDQPLLDGIDALLAGATLGHPEIRCRPAISANPSPASRLEGPTAGAPVRVRLVPSRGRHIVPDFRGQPVAEPIRQLIADDLAADVVHALSFGTRLQPWEVQVNGGSRPVVPGDIAVLVRTNRAAARVRAGLEAAGVPAVIHGGGSVFATSSGRHWLQLLEALERPASSPRARAAALTDFVGWDAARLAGATSTELGDLHADLRSWASALETQGIGALVDLIGQDTALPARVLGRPDGERRLTDLHHVAQLLQAEAVAERLGVAALTAWLRRRVAEGERTDAAEERSRRLESDADAVQVLTIHRSKGLEFPLVYLPDLAEDDGYWGLPTYHDPDTGRRTLDVGSREDKDHPDYQRHWNLFVDEQRGEDLRQAYVALTRARHQVILWWAPFRSQALSPLTRLLLAERDPSGLMRPRSRSDEDAIRSRLVDLAVRNKNRLAVEPVEPVAEGTKVRRWAPGNTGATQDLAARYLERKVDSGWRRTSYTAITAGAHQEATVGSEAEDAGLVDEVAVTADVSAGASVGPATDDVAARPSTAADGGVVAATVLSGLANAGDEAALRARPSPMATLERGASFGIAVHALLEAVDFATPDLPEELRRSARRATRFGQGIDPDGLAGALAAVIDTPLGPTVGDRPLSNVAQRDRLDELAFELPLAGGDTPTGEVGVSDIAALLGRWLPDGDPLAGYAEALADPALDAVLRGYLTGSIDLLWRVRPSAEGETGRASAAGDPAPASEERYVVVDYKTNWLAGPGEALTAWPYRPTALAQAMIKAHYPLQALLYSVAAHRYLRWRRTGYDPERHLGGILYLFVRGMSGADTPRISGQPCGVFAWQPPAGLVVELSDLLDGRRP